MIKLSLAAMLLAGSVIAQTIEVRGLKEPVELLVDKWGVPHVYAKNFDDVFFGQGFNAARDRLLQIDLWRRRGLGELAEVLGPKYVEQDKAARFFLYRGDMEKEWAAYGSDAKRMATAYVAGVNAYIDWVAGSPDRMPVEFKVLRYAPSKWRPEDVVRIRTHGLTGNLTNEVTRASTICRTDTKNGPKYDQLRARLEPKWDLKVPDGLDPCLPADVLRIFSLATQGVRFDGDGSNNWTIGPSKSTTGRPIVANDPHRAYSTPSLRYIAHLSAPGLDVIGGGEPSLPGIAIGHNGTAAFGLTRFYIDQEDLYVYELNPANAREYRYRGAWEPMRIVRETFQVKGAAPVEAELPFTRHGPVIYSDTAARRAYAVRSCWLEPGTAVYFGSASYMRAKNYTEFQQGIARAGAPGLNYVYGDVQGNIAWVVGGRAPIRPNWDGLMPVPGDGRFEWAGFWTADKLPSIHNPASGFISTSNEMNLPAGYPYQERKLGFEWANPSRHTRIEEVLKSLPKSSVEDSMRLQTDVTSVPARRLVRLLAPLGSTDAKTKAALDFLRGWDAVERIESPEAALMELWISRHLGRAFIQEMVPAEAADVLRTIDLEVMLEALEKPGSAAKKRDLVLLSSLTAAYREMESLQSADTKAWQWGKLHHSLPAHPLLNVVDPDLRAKLQVGPIPTPGGPHTPNAASYRANDFRQTGGASLRIVMDVGQWDNSRAVNYPGQSGDPNDPHYRDLMKMWVNGEYFPLLYSRAAVEKAVDKKIRLMPRK
jgi:penicillin G amidase